MPIKGKPERPHTSGNQGIAAEGVDTIRGFDFLVGLELADAPFLEFPVSLVAVDRSEIEFPVQLIAVDRKQLEFAVGAELVDVDGTEIQKDLFSVSAELGAPAGYPSTPRLNLPGQVVVGQRVQRRGEVIPTAD